jgi:hypothetical protein
MSNASYLRLNLPPTATDCAVVRAAIRALHPDTLAVRSFREARKRFYRDMLLQHATRRYADRPAQPDTSVD